MKAIGRVRALRVGMVVYGDIRHDSRVQREAISLADAGHELSIYCLAGSVDEIPVLAGKARVVAHGIRPGTAGPGSPSPFRGAAAGGRLVRVARRAGWLARYVGNLVAWGRWVASQDPQVDVLHAHDFTGLIAARASLQRNARVVYDVHDLFVETGSGRLLPPLAQRMIQRLERYLVRRVDLVVAVNEALASLVTRGSRPRSTIVVHNCPPRWEPPSPRPDLIRNVAGIPPEVPVILYHGLLGRSRGIDQLLEAIQLPALAKARLVLMGYGEMASSLVLRSSEPRFAGRVHVLDPVPPSELLQWVASADVGALAMPNDSLNLYLSTPNKLFECLAAGTPVVVSSFPAVKQIVWDDPGGPLGAICDPADPADVARAISEILALDSTARLELRRRCLAAAHDRWNWESEVARLTEAYALLVPHRGRG